MRNESLSITATTPLAVSSTARSGRRFQFSLRHLLVAITVVAIFLAAYPKTASPDIGISTFCCFVIAMHLSVAYWAARREGKGQGEYTTSLGKAHGSFEIYLLVAAVPVSILTSMTLVLAYDTPYSGYSFYMFFGQWLGPMLFWEVLALLLSIAMLVFGPGASKCRPRFALGLANLISNLITCALLFMVLAALASASC